MLQETDICTTEGREKKFPLLTFSVVCTPPSSKDSDRRNKYVITVFFSYSKLNILLPVTVLLTSSLEAMNNEVIPMS